jgi:ATP-binding cassette subfamily B protein
LKFTINSIEKGISFRELTLYSLAIVGLGVLHLIFRFLMRYTMIGASRKIEYDLRNDFFAHLLTQSMSFYHNHKTGDLMARATNDLNAVRSVVGPALMHTIANLLLFIYVIALMLVTSWKLTLLTLIPLPFVAILSRLVIKRIYNTFKAVQAKYSDLTSMVQENMSGVRVIKAYVREENEVQEFENINQDYLKLNLKLTRVRAMLFAGMSFLMGLGMVVLLGMGGWLVIAQDIQIGDFVAFTVWLGMLAWPMISYGWIMNLLQQGAASMARINTIMDTPPDIVEDERTDYSIKDFQGSIEFRNVSFTYPGLDEKVFDNVSIHLKQGETLAIIGPTGSGKTTLVNLICRLIETDEGEILIDGMDIRTFPLRTLRKNIGYVPQETFLFSESIADNISFGIETTSFEEIERAATFSTIRFDVEDFPKQYDTMVGERGITLSGGQKQRTALSRAIIRRPKILILDDAFSSVDTETEEKILNRFKDEMTRQTNIVISQRVSTVKNADHIIVLSEGRIIERGTHKSLLKGEGFYADLHRKQLLQEAIEKM